MLKKSLGNIYFRGVLIVILASASVSSGVGSIEWWAFIVAFNLLDGGSSA